MRNLIFSALAAAVILTSSGCCGLSARVCDGPCGGADGCNWYPGKCLLDNLGCNSGCGGLYWSDWHCEPPDCCDPCCFAGRTRGRSYQCDSGCGDGCSGGWGGWTGGCNGGHADGVADYAGVPGYSGGHGGGCNCGGGGHVRGGHIGPTPTPAGEVIYESNARPRQRVASSRIAPTPIPRSAPMPIPRPAPTKATAARPIASQASAPRVRYNASTNTARQQPPRRIRPANHVDGGADQTWQEQEAEIIEPQPRLAAPINKPCTSCRR